MTALSRRQLIWLFAAFSIGGCATSRDSASIEAPAARVWSGRLTLDLETEPRQTFFAFFELKGATNAGELILSGPLGNTIASILWTPREASLRTGEATRQFDSVEALTHAVTGAALPVGAVFDWLAGIETAPAGWRADLSRLGQGRVSARRTAPEPAANLKLILDAPPT